MKKLFTLVLFILALSDFGQCARIITSFDIVRWYLDADVVLICQVDHTDTITVTHVDSLMTDGSHLQYDILREQYLISVDSILKGASTTSSAMDTIFTPGFHTTITQWTTTFTGLDANGDSTFTTTFGANLSYQDDSYFRIKSPEKRLIILHKQAIGYVIDYQSSCDSSTMNLIREAQLKGEDYFKFLLLPSVKSKNIQIYPNPLTDFIHIEGIQAKHITVTDLHGKTTVIKFQNPNLIDLSQLRSGAYVITISNGNRKWTEKIVKE